VEKSKICYIRGGRGNTGGTTGLSACVELALMEGRKVTVTDAARNPTFSSLYPDICTRPKSHTIPDVKEAITRHFDKMLDDDCQGVIDIGGGQDDVLGYYKNEVDFKEFGEEMGITIVYFVTFGPNVDDYEHAQQVKERGIFGDCPVLLVQSEGMLRMDQSPRDAFDAIEARPDYVRWVKQEGARPLYLPTLACLPLVRQLKLTLRDAATNQPSPDGEKIGTTNAYKVRKWLREWKESFTTFHCEEWRL